MKGYVQVYTGDGKGKCVTEDTYILTVDGLWRVNDLIATFQPIEPGQFVSASVGVISPFGASTTTAAYNGGITDVLWLTTSFGYRLGGTPEHPVLSLTPEGTIWCPLSELQVGDYVAVARGHSAFGEVRRSLNKAYLAGILIGDGCIQARKRAWRIALSSSDASCVQAWRSYLYDHGTEPVTYSQRPLDYRVDGKELVQVILGDLWLVPERAEDKVIDHRWLKCDRETLRALLQGLFDSDGSADCLRGDVEFCTTSFELACQVHLLLLSFGIVGKLYRRQTKSQNGHGRPSWRLQLRGAEAAKFYERVGFRLLRKQERRRLVPSKHNPNADVIPHTWDLLRCLPLSGELAPKRSHKGPQPKYACQFMRQTRFYRERGVRASYAAFAALLDHPAVLSSPEADVLHALVGANYFWDRVDSVKHGRAQVYDFCVPDVQAFIANGIVSHNTTAALGLALRASGHGMRTYIGQFMKGQQYGELDALRDHPCITIEQYGDPRCIRREEVTPEHIVQAQRGLEQAREAMLSGVYDIVVLDEVNVALWFGLLEVDDVLSFLDQKPERVEVILTGRRAPQELTERADLVTEMREVKHYYAQGVIAREGIER